MLSYKRVAQHSGTGTGTGSSTGSSDRADLYRLRQWTEGNFSIEIAASFAMRKQWAKVLNCMYVLCGSKLESFFPSKSIILCII